MSARKGNASVIIIAILAVVAAISLSAAGYFHIKSQDQTSLAVSKLQPPTTQTNTIPTTVDETANWKTYTNNDYGFSIMYPPTYSYYEVPPGYVRFFQGPNDPNLPRSETYLSIQIKDNPQKLSLSEWQKQKVIVANHEPFPKGVKYIENNGTIFQITPIIMNGEDTNGNTSKIFDQILSTFKFVNFNSDTSSWQTFQNALYGFQFSYPATYSITSDSQSNCAQFITNQTPCLVSLLIQSDPSEFAPKASFYFVKGVNSINLAGQVSGISYDQNRKVWIVKNPVPPDQALPTWGQAKSGQDIIKGNNGGSHGSSNYYLIPDYQKDIVAIFAIPDSYRLRCDNYSYTNETAKQTACETYYKNILTKFNGGQESPDTWLPQSYLSSIYADAETMIKSFSFK